MNLHNLADDVSFYNIFTAFITCAKSVNVNDNIVLIITRCQDRIIERPGYSSGS